MLLKSAGLHGKGQSGFKGHGQHVWEAAADWYVLDFTLIL